MQTDPKFLCLAAGQHGGHGLVSLSACAGWCSVRIQTLFLSTRFDPAHPGLINTAVISNTGKFTGFIIFH